MFGASATRKLRQQPDDLFTRIGAFLRAQGLSADPANYVFAHHLLTRDDPAAAAIVARICEDGTRLTGGEIERLGGRVTKGVPIAPHPAHRACDDVEADGGEAERLVVQTRRQVDAVATMVRAMHDETRGFGRDLAQSAAAFGVKGVPADSGEIVRLTTTMIGRVTDAEERLASATREAETLRAELVEAQASARCDPLTGLPNRRAFEEAFAALDNGGSHCLALCDIDRFKRINDEFGHAVGDRVLSAFARLLTDHCAGQLVTRQGGEEFAVLLSGVDLDEAAHILDGARAVTAGRRLRDRDSDAPIGTVTFSAGLVAIAAGETADDALARADRLLYAAKAKGRNQVVAE
ncbi:GGDEF domain-containing protein [Sphingomonas bacterium]|uniref:GGDEF domain-containing protein n=1 Tax=Sphingomonas bacterium TaxID=1895847 RepID=UPI0015762FDC|nr:GGDEF domain-containing protein [Sphingomonas bacterium]